MSAHDHDLEAEGCGGNAAPYVLGALEQEEYEAFQNHLATCAVCREEVAALQLVADALPATAPQLSAPAELKARIMATVQEEAGWQRAAESPEARRRPAGARSGFSLRDWRPLGAVAALAAVIAILAVAVQSGGGAGTRTIRAQVSAPNASASLRVSGGQAELNVVGLPQTPPDRVYEVWIKRAVGAAQPTDALFTVTAAGRATVGVPGKVTGVKQIMVTSEPLGGSRVPTRAPVIVASLS